MLKSPAPAQTVPVIARHAVPNPLHVSAKLYLGEVSGAVANSEGRVVAAVRP
jgi:hypothetical protein